MIAKLRFAFQDQLMPYSSRYFPTIKLALSQRACTRATGFNRDTSVSTHPMTKCTWASRPLPPEPNHGTDQTAGLRIATKVSPTV